MSSPEPQGHESRGHNTIESTDSTHQRDRRPPKKRKSSEDSSKVSSPSQVRRISSEKEKLEARRISNRLSAQRFRLRQKSIIKEQDNTIKELRRRSVSLQVTNNTLYAQLEQALRLNRQLRRLIDDEMQVLLEQNRSLQSRVNRQIGQQNQVQHGGTANMTSLLPNTRFNDLPPVSALYGREREIRRDVAPNKGSLNGSMSTQRQDLLSVERQVQSLQHEIKELLKKLQEKS